MAAPALNVAIMARSVGMATSDDETHQRRRPSSLTKIKRYREVQNDNIEQHEREPGKGKITQSHIHAHAVRRVDSWIDMRVLGATKRDLPTKEWLCFCAMEFGMVEDKNGILRMHKGKLEPVERDLTFDEVAAHYGLTRDTVERYDQHARKVFKSHRMQAEYMTPEE
jgi:hypothetical protein